MWGEDLSEKAIAMVITFLEDRQNAVLRLAKRAWCTMWNSMLNGQSRYRRRYWRGPRDAFLLSLYFARAEQVGELRDTVCKLNVLSGFKALEDAHRPSSTSLVFLFGQGGHSH